MEELVNEKTNEQKAQKKNFICGVVEGFYGRPWTTEQRKDLFRKLKKCGMDSYIYAPKDDCKHRAFWRELYTVEEADHLSSLIAAAKEHGITFYYALSPGLDMTYSNQKEIQTLKRKLDQVSQFGCEAFALLFDDIESELSKVDKEVFQTFGNAQVSVTNEVYTHLGNPKFLFCPTQYCSSRAVPTVNESEYLNTLGSKLNHDIDIMWTGTKVISKNITIESIQEITEILRRPPVIWDNLHANDYDQKRVFLGPYTGRSPELIPHLRGVMTNPNCEFHANTIAIQTLAYWSKCSLGSKVNSSLSADIKLETENEDEGSDNDELPLDDISQKIYHPRIALKNAIAEWLPEFYIKREAWGPITKPQPQVTMVMPIIPIIPSINTCMSLTTTTTTSTTSKSVAVPEVNTTQLQALADVCSTVNSSALNPITNPVMNSLVSPTKVITNDDILNPIPTNIASNIELPKKIPISIVPVPIMDVNSVVEMGGHANTNDSNSSTEADGEKIDASSTHSTSTKIDNAFIEITQNEIGINDAGIISESSNVNDLNDVTIDGNLEQPIEDIGIGLCSEIEEDVTIDEKLSTAGNLASMETMLDDNLSPISTGNEPMECSSSLNSLTSPKDERKPNSEDVVMAEDIPIDMDVNNVMQIESSEPSPLSNADMKVEDEIDEKNDIAGDDESCKMTMADLCLLCDLFYLPFEHGSRGLKFLVEFNWLKANANVLLSNGRKKSTSGGGTPTPKPEVIEWHERAKSFGTSCLAVQNLLRKIANCANKEICHDLFSYVWDIAGALSLLNAFVKWLSLGEFPPNVFTYIQGSYTWFSKGWRETFMSGDQEPWVFRGGLIADLQRLMPVDSGNDLFMYKLPELPTCEYHLLRPYAATDENDVITICVRNYFQIDEETSTITEEYNTLPDNVRNLIADSIVGPFITFFPNMCIVAYDTSNRIVGYAAAAVDVNDFTTKSEMGWLPEMREKYPQTMLDTIINDSDADDLEKKKLNKQLTRMINDFHNTDAYQCPTEVSVSYPAILTLAVLNTSMPWDCGVIKRLITVSLATLRANGCFGVHIRFPAADLEQAQNFSKLGFTEVHRDSLTNDLYYGRRF